MKNGIILEANLKEDGKNGKYRLYRYRHSSRFIKKKRKCYQKIDAPPRLKSHGLRRCSIFGCKKFLLEEKFLHRSLSLQTNFLCSKCHRGLKFVVFNRHFDIIMFK